MFFEKIVKYSTAKKGIKIFNFFFKDDTSYYAASLSFFTIFSLLPILALLICIVSALPEFENYFKQFIDFVFETLNPTHSELFVKYLTDFIENVDKLGYIGLAYMIFISTIFFMDYDYIVNKIHQAPSRPIYLTFFLYLSLIIFMPMIFTIYIFVLVLFENFLFKILVNLLYFWIVVFFLFKFSINKKINTKTVVISSFITVVSLVVIKNIFIYYAIYNKTYTTLYGSFAIMLFFFLWIYISWVIYLYGIKFCNRLNIKAKAIK